MNKERRKIDRHIDRKNIRERERGVGRYEELGSKEQKKKRKKERKKERKKASKNKGTKKLKKGKRKKEI